MEFSRKTRRAIIERAAGKCEACAAVLKTGEGEVDHILPAALGGDASVANGRLICRLCHAAKTAADIVRVRKADRQRDKNSPAIRPKGSIPQRPKVEKASGKMPLPPRRIYALQRPVWTAEDRGD